MAVTAPPCGPVVGIATGRWLGAGDAVICDAGVIAGTMALAPSRTCT